MKKIVMFSLSIFLMTNFAFSQEDILLESEAPDNAIRKDLVQKSIEPWTLQFNNVVNAYHPPACIVSDGSYLYLGDCDEERLLEKIDFNNQKVEDIYILGIPDSEINDYRGIAYDGTYFYMVFGSRYIYKIDLATRSVVGNIELPENTIAVGITYAPDADGGNGGFWVSLHNDYAVKLFSRTGTLLSSISGSDLGYVGKKNILGLAYDTISIGGPFIWAFERLSQNIIKINPSTKKIGAPIHHFIEFDYEADYYFRGIYIQRGIVDSTVTLGLLRYNYKICRNVGYDLASTLLPDVAMEIDGTNLKSYYKVGHPISIKANVYNAGKTPITSYHYNYEINNKTYTKVETGVNIIDVYPRTEIIHDSAFIPTTNDFAYSIKLWISDINDNHALHSDTFSTTFHSYPIIYTPRTLLHEVFTSSTSPYCNRYNANLDSILKINEGKFSCIKYQMYFPYKGDPYYTDEGGIRFNYYGNSIPNLFVDGKNYNNNNDYTSELLNMEYLTPSFVDLNSTLVFDGLSTFKAKVIISPLKTFSGTNKLYVALVEKVTTKNAKTNGQNEFHYIFKKFMTNTDGDSILLIKDSIKEINLSYTFEGSYRLPANGQPENIIDNTIENSVEEMTDLIIVYWIQNNTTKEILQSGSSGQISTINEYQSNNIKATVYPNPSHGNVTIKSSSQINKIKVFNLVGQLIFNREVKAKECTINTTYLNPGLYIVQLQTPDGIINRKISIK